jgi:hypothetical protein
MEPKSLIASLMTSLSFTVAIVIALGIFVAALPFGLWCSRVWQRRTWSHAATDLKRRAQRG